mmetsp:Transcript_16090/g.39409  ORF Transcript_16090/g.39409 Transcript_16090/m.39409 type:complete len:82 (+) Transcript_16090:1519-1764(+)
MDSTDEHTNDFDQSFGRVDLSPLSPWPALACVVVEVECMLPAGTCNDEAIGSDEKGTVEAVVIEGAAEDELVAHAAARVTS